MERLEKNGISNVADIMPFYQKEGLAQSFYAPSGRFTVEGKGIPLEHIIRDYALS